MLWTRISPHMSGVQSYVCLQNIYSVTRRWPDGVWNVFSDIYFLLSLFYLNLMPYIVLFLLLTCLFSTFYEICNFQRIKEKYRISISRGQLFKQCCTNCNVANINLKMKKNRLHILIIITFANRFFHPSIFLFDFQSKWVKTSLKQQKGNKTWSSVSNSTQVLSLYP